MKSNQKDDFQQAFQIENKELVLLNKMLRYHIRKYGQTFQSYDKSCSK